MDPVSAIVHFEIEVAASIHKGLTFFNNWHLFGVDKKLGSNLQRAGRIFSDSESDDFINPNNNVCPLTPFSKTV